MALAATTVWEIRVSGDGGADTNGGGFNQSRTGTATDRTLGSAFKTGTNLTVDHTTNTDVTPDGYTPDATADPGNLIQITTTGTGAAFTVGFYEILSVQSGKWRLDRSPAAIDSAGATWAMGGGLLTIAKMFTSGPLIAGNTVYLKGGVYAVSAAFTITQGSQAASTTLVGYTTTRTLTNTDTKPQIQLAAGHNNITVCSLSQQTTIRNVEIDNTGASTGNIGISAGGLYCVIENCKVSGFKTGISSLTSTTANIVGTEVVVANENSAIGITLFPGLVDGCYIHGGTSTGTNGIVCKGATIANTVVAGMTSSNTIGISLAAQGCMVNDCVVYNIGVTGISSNQQGCSIINTILSTCTTTGILMSATTDSIRVINCAGYANGTNTSGLTTLSSQGFLAISVDPFVSASTANFTLNNTVGGGASLRAAGFPASLPGVTGTSYHDVGAFQSTVPNSNLYRPRQRTYGH